MKFMAKVNVIVTIVMGSKAPSRVSFSDVRNRSRTRQGQREGESEREENRGRERELFFAGRISDSKIK